MGTLKVIGSALYQWEIGRKIRIDASVGNRAVEVQFAHPGDKEALSVIPKEENGIIVAEVPNIMLQSADKLIVFLVEMDENCVETTRHSVFHVVNRPRPADYIYTETEVLNYTYLDNRLKELEGDGLANAVADYLGKNPPQAGATEEEAEQIAKNKTDIEQLAQDKLDASKLPEAVNDALAQAKASGEFKGEPGEPGKTPEKGKDYFTDADKREIAEQAAEMVEVPEGGTVTDEQIASAVEDYMAENPVDGDGWPTSAKNLLITILRNGVYNTDQSANITALATEVGVTEEEPDIPDVPDEPEKTLTSISATYSGGDVAVGTAVTALTGIVVTAHYSDGSTATVTGYTLSGTIAEGSNTITVSYGGKTTTFTVTGVAESGGGDSNPTLLYNWDFTNSLTDTVAGNTVALTGDGATQGAGGLSIVQNDSTPTYASFTTNIHGANRRYEFDVSSAIGEDHLNFFFLHCNALAGLFYYPQGKAWTFYSSVGWEWIAANLTTVDAISGKTVSVVINEDYSWDLYLDGELVAQSGVPVSKSSNALTIGCTSVVNCSMELLVTGLRVYDLGGV